MATADAIRDVSEMLGSAAAAAGWDDTRIGADLDAGKTPNKIALQWWIYQSAKTANLTQVSESGSSRTLSDIWEHAIKMRDYFQGLVDKEDNPPVIDPTGYGLGIKTFPIRRIAR